MTFNLSELINLQSGLLERITKCKKLIEIYDKDDMRLKEMYNQELNELNELLIKVQSMIK